MLARVVYIINKYCQYIFYDKIYFHGNFINYELYMFSYCRSSAT